MEEKLMSKNSLTVLAQKLAEKTGISQQDAELFIRKMFDVANEGLQADKQVKMKWLGTFKVTSVKDRESVDVNTGERIVIEGRDKISFTPDTILKEIINKPFAQFETVVVNDGVEFDEIDRKFEAEELLAENRQMNEAEEIPEPLDGSEASDDTSEATDISEISDTSETSDVIDFLEETDTPSVSDEVVVIGESESHYDTSPEIITETIVEKSVKEMKDEAGEQEEVQNESENQEEPADLRESEPEPEPVSDSLSESEFEPDPESELEPEPTPELEPEPTSELEPESKLKSASDSEPLVEAASASDSETSEDSESYDTFESTKKGVVIPRYLVVVACFIIVALIGGIGWFAFNYGKMAAQRDHLALQLDNFHQDNKAAKPTPASLSQEEILRKKAIEDSIRMVQASEAVKMAEADGKQVDKKDSLLAAKQQKDAEAKKQAELNKQTEAKKLAEAKKHQTENATAHASAKYDQDVRIRTGAYRIVGVAEVVTAREGQTIEAISKRYFGPGMECYVEALNGSGKLKAGQKVKIPKLELKKKSSKTK